MRPCDLCDQEPIAHVVSLGDRADRRVWLCSACGRRHEDHDLDPSELLALARRASARCGQCEWCGTEPPSAQVRVPNAEGRVFAFHLCAACAQKARSTEGTRVLHPEVARTGEAETTDPRYERAVEIARRRRQMRRIK